MTNFLRRKFLREILVNAKKFGTEKYLGLLKESSEALRKPKDFTILSECLDLFPVDTKDEEVIILRNILSMTKRYSKHLLGMNREEVEEMMKELVEMPDWNL
jgi:hypothetical protein